MSSLFSHAIRLRIKRGAPEHRDPGALTGSPALTPGLDHGTRPGIPAAAELARGQGPKDVEHEGERGEGGGSHGPGLAVLRTPIHESDAS